MNEKQTDIAGSFLALLRPIRRELEVYCHRLIWHEHDAPDALQNAAMNAFKAFDRYHDDANFRAWMFKILTNEIFAANRKRGRIAYFEIGIEPQEIEELTEAQFDRPWPTTTWD